MAFKQLLLLVFLGLPILCCSIYTIVVFQCIYRNIFISTCRYLQRDYIKIQLAAVYFLLSAGWFRQAAFPVEPNNQPVQELKRSTTTSINFFFTQKVEPNNQSKSWEEVQEQTNKQFQPLPEQSYISENNSRDGSSASYEACVVVATKLHWWKANYVLLICCTSTNNKKGISFNLKIMLISLSSKRVPVTVKREVAAKPKNWNSTKKSLGKYLTNI